MQGARSIATPRSDSSGPSIGPALEFGRVKSCGFSVLDVLSSLVVAVETDGFSTVDDVAADVAVVEKAAALLLWNAVALAGVGVVLLAD